MSSRQYMTNLDEITENYGFLTLARGKVEVTSNISNAVIFKVSLHTYKLLSRQFYFLISKNNLIVAETSY